MLLVKLGGSVITDKSRYRTLRAAHLSRLARELARARVSEAIVVHGAGSFGHVLAAKHRLHEGYSNPAQIGAAAQVQRDVRALDLAVLDALLKAGLRPVSIPPSAVMRCRAGKVEAFDVGVFREYLRSGFLPVSFGDVVLDAEKGFTVASGDDVILELARAFRPDRVVFVADVDGVYTDDPKRSKSSSRLDVVDGEVARRIASGVSPGTADVTGGLRGKLERMLAIASVAKEVRIVNGLVRGRLEQAARGDEVVGTRVVS